MSRIRVVAVLVAVVSMLATLQVASGAAGRGGDQAAARHAEAVAFWTHARVAQARSLDLVVDPATGEYRRQAGPPSCVPKWHPDCGGDGGGDPDPTLDGDWAGTDGGPIESTVGKVLFAFGKQYYVCSATLVNLGGDREPVALTAGHCVLDERKDKFASQWIFIPDYDGAPAPLNKSNTSYCDDTVHGCWTAAALVTTTGWADGDFNYDVGFARLGSGGKSGQSLAITDTITTSQGLEFTSSVGEEVDALGYPAADPYDGTKLIACTGVPFSDGNAGAATQGLACTMTGGSSGGPWFTGVTPGSDEVGLAQSVNSYKYTNDDSTMYGPIFASWTSDVYTAALNGPSRLVSTG